MDVLKQRVAKHVLVGGVANHGRDVDQAGFFGSTEAAFTHDQLKGWLAVLFTQWANNDRLQDTEFLDRMDEFAERLIIEDGARVDSVWNDLSE